MKATLSPTYVERLSRQPAPTSDAYHWDTAVKGFGVRVAKSGRITWIFQRKVNGKDQRHMIGAYPEMDYHRAWKEAVGLAGMVMDGANPKAEKIKASIAAVTVKEVFEFYLAKPMKDATRYNTRLHVEKHLYGPFGEWNFADFTRPVFLRHIETNYKDKPGTAYNLVLHTRAAWNFAISRGHLPKGTENPAEGVTRILGESGFSFRASAGYRMALEDGEISNLLRAITDSHSDRDVNPIGIACLELVLHTGARKNELQTLRFDEIDMDRRTITKVDHKTAGKTGEPRIIRLSDAAVEVLKRAEEARKSMKRDNDEWVFPSSGREGSESPHITDLNRYTSFVGKKCGLPALKPHNLRSLYINIAIDAGLPIQVVAENVGHSNIQTTMLHYIKNKKSTLMNGMNAVGERLSALAKMED